VISFTLDGRPVEVPSGDESLLESLREHLGCRAPKDGCSPQGQCGCCTVLIDGMPRVSCVTPTRRVAGRSVTTTEGLPVAERRRWADAFVATGASQCGFCTPGILLRLSALEGRAAARDGGGEGEPGKAGRRGAIDEAAVRTALLAHLCRCTGWQTVVEAACEVLGVQSETAPRSSRPHGPRDPLLVQWRAQVEGPAYQASGPDTVLGGGGFADDTAPPGALVAVPDADGDLVVATSLAGARRRSGKVQGRNSTGPLTYPVTVPEGSWALTLRTTWVEPAYLEPDASWCRPGEEPASPLANGGAFGGKRHSRVPADARRLADERGQAVRVLWSREDVVRRGPKRPPVAGGIREDGTGILRFARGTGPRVRGGSDAGGQHDDGDVLSARVDDAAPGLVTEQVAVPGPVTSTDLRGAGWVEASVLAAGVRALGTGRVGPGTPVEVTAPSGGRARVAVAADDSVSVDVWAGEVLDEVTLRSYCIGAVHQALGWVRSEGIAVDDDGVVLDLTIRSFGILTARDTPRVSVVVHESGTWPVNGSDAVFAATAAAAWLADGLVPEWPTRRGRGSTPARSVVR